MTESDTPWEPPIAGTEAEHVVGALERLRATFRWKADALDAEGLGTTIGRSTLTIGGLLKHLAVCEDNMFAHRLSGEPIGEPWASMGWDQNGSWSFTFDTAGLSPTELYALWDGAVERSRTRLAQALEKGGLEQPVWQSWQPGQHLNLRRLLCDLIEEYGRHTGHTDLIREAVDGRVGEDPPPGWRPTTTPG
jgi:hypothetical protein